MPENKKFGTDEKDPNLKKEDQRKISAVQGSGNTHGMDIFGGRRMADKSVGSNVKVKKKLPIAVDIIAGILMLAIVCGIVVGSYMLFRYYSDDYDTKSLSCTVFFNADEELNKYMSMKNGDLYMDFTDNTVYFGRITEVRTDEDNNRVILQVTVDARYRDEEGYSLGEIRLAVGGEYKLRYIENTLNVSLVELSGGN
ncbi:MAG: hypothetical protein J6L83_09210 [Clostridia bacterium]|nr:hypothetical protein [Clostridia bacterium]